MIRTYVDDLNANFIAGKNAESIKPFDAAIKIHRQYTSGAKVLVDPKTLFTDPALKAHFNIQPADELALAPSYRHSKDSPRTNVQALMTYELMTKGLSSTFWLENNMPRLFDTHLSRTLALKQKGTSEQQKTMQVELWSPLKALVAKLKSTPYGNTGKSYYDYTTILLTSEMGRTLDGNVADVLKTTASDAVKYKAIQEQDVCQHWHVNSFAMLGGTVKAGTQFGRVGTSTFAPIPLPPDTGALDPAFDAITGVLRSGQTASPGYVVPDTGHVYATSLYLSGFGVDLKGFIVPQAAGQSVGRNFRVPLKFVKR